MLPEKLGRDLSPSAANREFHTLLQKLHEPVEQLPEHTEKHRGEELLKEIPAHFQKAVASDLDDEATRGHLLAQTRDLLTELERLVAGQKMLFTAAARVAARFRSGSTQEVFKELNDILDNIEGWIQHDSMRVLGIKPGPKAPGPRGPKAPKTYAKAQDEILAELAKTGWKVVPHLKIPHATNPDGTFRFWFKPQAIYYSTGREVKNFGEARSIFTKDYRFEPPHQFAEELLADAKRLER